MGFVAIDVWPEDGGDSLEAFRRPLLVPARADVYPIAGAAVFQEREEIWCADQEADQPPRGDNRHAPCGESPLSTDGKLSKEEIVGQQPDEIEPGRQQHEAANARMAGEQHQS